MFRHLFDGSALLQQFTIKKGEVTYLCRFQTQLTTQFTVHSSQLATQFTLRYQFVQLCLNSKILVHNMKDIVPFSFEVLIFSKISNLNNQVF